MQGANQFFLRDYQIEELGVIKGVSFSPREIDILSCLMHMRGPSKISSLLSISPYTVTSHIRNIMLKIGCNSREGILDFIEQSFAGSMLNKHYARLSLHAAFEKCLKDIATIKGKDTQALLLLYGEDPFDTNILINHLENHLKQAGIEASIKNVSTNPSVEDLLDNSKALVLLLNKGDQEKIPKELSVFDFIDASDHQAYYFLVFEILKKLLHPINITPYLQNFRDQHTDMTNASTNESLQLCRIKPKRRTLYEEIQSFKNKKWSLVFIISCFLFTCYTFYIFKGSQQMPAAQSQEEEEKEEGSIRSDLPIPIPSVLLKRSEEIAQIDEKLGGATGIQTIALVGPGGIGKTILSRQYAHHQKAKVIWELNAETLETLKSSFEDLATALAQTEKDQKFLIGLLEIRDARTREKKLIRFVKQHLKLHVHWLLIFDNVESFQDIQSYFPQDATTWGQGKILLTTRNSNIQHNKYVKDILRLQELNPSQKLALFMKIIAQGNPKPLMNAQKDETKQFLEKIPSYPLDVAMAAYYLKTANISYDLFLQQLSKNNKIFTNIQEKILKEAGDYIKTRYGIITLSLQHLIDSHKEFSNLLLFMCLLDSQHIPRSLLASYQRDIQLVDAFIFDLKKYSLVINDSLPSLPPSLPLKITFSMHRSTQEIGLAYLTKILKLEKNSPILQNIAKSFETYITEFIEKEDLSKLRLLISHCETFLSHKHLLTKETQSSISTALGGIYLSLGNYEKAKDLLEKELSVVRHTLSRAHALSYLGNVYGDLGHYDKAQYVLEQSLLIYQKYFPENQTGIARTLAYLGNVHRDLGNYEKARDLLEQSVAIYEEHPSLNPIGNAWSSGCLGIIYTILGDYDKARQLLEKSLAVYQKFPTKNGMGMAWVLAHLGDVYGQLEEYEQAKELFEQSIAVYKEHFPEGHIKTGWALSALGEIYRSLKDYKKARITLEESLLIYKKHLSENHIVTAGILVYLGAVYKDLGDYEKAKNLLEQSLVIYKKHFPKDHNEIAWALAHLGDTHRAMGEHETARSLLEESLSMYRKFFSEDHVEVLWALDCLKHVGQELRDKEL